MKDEHITKPLLEVVSEENEQIFFASSLGFINSHRGYRPSSMHLFIGIAGGGKSTLSRTLLIDIMKMGQKIFLWLSEDSKLSYLAELNKAYGEFDLEKLVTYSEQDGKVKNLLAEIEKRIIEKEIKFLFFDNITTSAWYGNSPDKQHESALKLKEFVNKTGVTLVLFAHTDSKIIESHSSQIDQTQIRGSKTIVNLTDFLYILQRFSVQDKIVPTIRVVKYRSQNPKDRLFRLAYSERNRIYWADTILSFDEFNEIYNMSDRMGKKGGKNENKKLLQM
jgi:KaiC/GvpD/RAD55 family RecA-like ATPase